MRGNIYRLKVRYADLDNAGCMMAWGWVMGDVGMYIYVEREGEGGGEGRLG